MCRGIRIIATGFAILGLLLFGGCYMEEKFIFFPIGEIAATPRDFGLSFEDVYFKTEDGVTLNGWFVASPGASKTLLWFHGNGGNIGHRSEHLKLLHDKLKIHIFIFDYRGYGKSQGKPSEEGTYKDGMAALEHLRSRQNVEAREIFLFGQSLGAAVATEIAVRQSRPAAHSRSALYFHPRYGASRSPMAADRLLASNQVRYPRENQRGPSAGHGSSWRL